MAITSTKPWVPASSSISSLSAPATARLAPKTLYTVAGATPASAAMASMVVAAYPSAANRRRAARAMCRLVAAACCVLHGVVTT